MPVRNKGEKVEGETGIWKDARGSGYVAEVSYRDPRTGARVRELKRTNRLDLAKDWRVKRREDALRGDLERTRRRTQPKAFASFADEYLESWSKVHKRPSSHKRDELSVRHLKEHFGRKPITAIERRDAEAFVAKRRDEGVTPATANRELCCLKNMLRKAVDWELLETNPAGGVKQARETPPEFDFLTDPEGERLLAECGPQLRGFVALALHTGMRRGELCRLEWRDVDFGTGRHGMVTVRETKNQRVRHIPMNARLRTILEAHPKRIVDGKVCPLVLSTRKGAPLGDMRKAFSNALAAAGIDRHIRIHDLRHTFASQLVMKGAGIETAAKLLGHRDIKVTMRYAHLAPDHLQAAVDLLTYETPAEETKETI